MAISDKNLTQKKSESKSIQHDSKQKADVATVQLEDNRPEAIAQLKWKEALSQQQSKENSTSVFSDQRSSTTQLQIVTTGESSEKSAEQSTPIAQRKSNQTGLPDSLKSGVEQLSGQSLDDVHVHTNSDKPAQLNAHAYAQGSDIHVAPGQEKHLPHEAWHVAQQKQGRVKPTKQLKEKTNINDYEGLEREADLMGAKAASLEDEVAQPKSISPVATQLIQFNKTEAPVADAGSSYSFTEPGFVFEKSQMRSLAAVAQIKQGPGNDATKADLVKNSKQKIGNELDPKALGFLVPVNIDVTPSHQIGSWTPTAINFQYGPLVASKDDAKLKAAAPGNQGYLDADKIIRSKANLLKKDGLKVVDDKNEASKKTGAKSGGSFRKIFSGDWEESEKRHERDKINSNEIARPEALKAGIESVKGSAGKEVQALSRLALAEDPKGTKVTPLGTYITLVGKNSFGLGKEFEFTSTFKLNSHTDYSADYLGTSVKVPPIQIGDPQNAELKVDIGEFTHEASDKGSVLSSNQGSAALSVLGQKATATWNSIELDTSKATDALKVKWNSVGLNLNMLGKAINFSIESPDLVDGKFTFTKASGEIDKLSPFSGVNFNNVKAEITAVGGAYDVLGEADIELQNLPGIESASGKVAISRASDGTMQYAMEGGNLTAKILGQTVSVNGVSYDSAKDPSRITADEASLALDLDVPTGGKVNGVGKLIKPMVSSEGFTYEGAAVDFSIIKLFNGVEFTEVKGELQSDTNELHGSAKFAVSSPTIANATGTVTIDKTAEAGAHYTLDDGTFDATVLGQTVNVDGATYDSQTPNEFSANAIQLDFNVLDTDFSFEVASPRINPAGFDFDSVKTTIPELSFGGAKLLNTEITLQKEAGSYSMMGITNFDITGELGGAKIEEATGQVTVSKQSGDSQIKVELAGAHFNLNAFGQKISVNELAYSDQVLTAGSAAIEVNAPTMIDTPLTGTLENVRIANSDFSFTSATITNIPQIDGGIIAVAPSEIKLNKDGKNYSVAASGSVTLKAFGDGNDQLLSGTGTVGYDFATKQPTYELSEVSASLKNPLAAYKIPESIPGIPWPVSIGAPIPIIPGVNVNINANFGGGIGFKEDINLSLAKSGDALTVEATTGVEGALNMAVSVGVLAGVPLLANVEAGLEAGGEFAAEADVTLNHTFNLGKDRKPAESDTLKPANDKAVAISGKGEISLLAKVFLKAQALVFIKKKVEKVLGKMVLGAVSFNSKESPKFKYTSRTEALQSKEEMENLNKTMLPKSFQGMSNEEVMEKLKTLRDEDNKLSKEAVKEFVDKFSLAEDAAAKDVFDRLNTLGYINYHNIQWSKLSALTKDNESSDKFKANIKLVGESILSKEAFLTEYDHLITKAKGFTEYAETAKLVAKHEQLLTFYNDLNVLKRKAHSQKFGDNFRQTITVLTGRFTRTKSQLGAVYAQLDEYRNLYPQVVELERTLMEKLDPPPVTSLPAEEAATA